jgi:hypothetical protein
LKKENKIIGIGELEIPTNYFKFTKKEKDELCNRIIDSLYKYVDRNLEPDISRISFLEGIFESSLITNEEDENYEMCMVLKDCLNILNED